MTTRPTSSRLGHLEHHLLEDLLHDGPQAAGTGAAQERLVGDRRDGLVVELELDAVDLEHALVLLDQGVPGLGEDAHERVLVELGDRGDDGQAADELGDQAVLLQVLGTDLGEQVALVVRVQQRGAEADAALARSGPR